MSLKDLARKLLAGKQKAPLSPVAPPAVVAPEILQWPSKKEEKPKTSETKKRHRDRLLEFGAAVEKDVPGRPATCAKTCYEVEPGKWIHHPWRGCMTK